MENYEKGQIVGRGTYGIVYRGYMKRKEPNEEKKLVALKKILFKDLSDGVNFTALREIKSLQEIHHPNVLQLFDVFVHKQNVYLVFEFMDFDLEMVIKDGSIILHPGDIKSYMLMLLKGVEHIHKRWILHRDLKPNNLLINSEGILKLADFGFARTFGSPNPQYTDQVVTRWYRSPELLFGAKAYGYGVDIWSIGCIFAELMLRTPYFSSESDLDQLSKIFAALGTPTEEQWPGMELLPNFMRFEPTPAPPMKELFTAASDDAIDLLSKLLRFNPVARPIATEALKHPYFNSSPPPTNPQVLPKLKKNFNSPVQSSKMSLSPAEVMSPSKRPLPQGSTIDERPTFKRKIEYES